ncbi:phosphoglycerate mutase 1-like [Artemia franciscana]|uniref:Phosphoglycerate mutase n=1 Tax=Artemia franciscana TaxID=6661 RepID=A0AA88HYE6_ARTSF|nr:hypothetical protein QYM36_005034 [Artemia franciscana]
MVYKIVMVRHGERAWNKENKFCGWFDAPLSKKGIQEAHAAGQLLLTKAYQFDAAHTSVLTRAQRTLKVILEEIQQSSLPVQKSWRLKWRLRSRVKHFDKLSDEAIMGINLPNRRPFAYELDDNLKPIKSMQFLGDKETVCKAMEAVANQGKPK